VSRRAAALAFAAVGLLACADIPGITPDPPAVPAPPPTPVSEPYHAAEGSLWQGGASQRFLAFENRARGVGDLLTVQIIEEARAENEATTDLERNSTTSASILSDVSLQTVITRPIINILGFLGFTDQRTDKEPTGEVTVVDAATNSKFEGDGTVTREATFETTVACLVTHVNDIGLMRIEGQRNMRINNETQVIRISGWVRPEDVRIDNTIPSVLIASADIEYGGVGLVSEKQRAPWLARLLELALPF
jgi:flagellar L-ring protein precursor FlgH